VPDSWSAGQPLANRRTSIPRGRSPEERRTVQSLSRPDPGQKQARFFGVVNQNSSAANRSSSTMSCRSSATKRSLRTESRRSNRRSMPTGCTVGAVNHSSSTGTRRSNHSSTPPSCTVGAVNHPSATTCNSSAANRSSKFVPYRKSCTRTHSQIPTASDAPPRHTSRGFLRWRFAYAGPGVRGITIMGPASANLHKCGSGRTIRSPRRRDRAGCKLTHYLSVKIYSARFAISARLRANFGMFGCGLSKRSASLFAPKSGPLAIETNGGA
jgi:hypothetical protein